MIAKLTDEERALALADLPLWTAAGDPDGIVRRFAFADFAAAFAFMTHVAIMAERADHHPEWSNVYGRVEVRLTTHDLGGVTSLDTALARIMEELADG